MPMIEWHVFQCQIVRGGVVIIILTVRVIGFLKIPKRLLTHIFEHMCGNDV